MHFFDCNSILTVLEGLSHKPEGEAEENETCVQSLR